MINDYEISSISMIIHYMFVVFILRSYGVTIKMFIYSFLLVVIVTFVDVSKQIDI